MRRFQWVGTYAEWGRTEMESTFMLILTRRIGETLCIGDEIQVTVLGVKGTQVRLGIAAPQRIPVLREEVRNRQAIDDEIRELLHRSNASLIERVG